MNHTRIFLLTSMAFLIVSTADATTIHPLLRRVLESDPASPICPQVLRGNSEEPASKTGLEFGIWVTTRDQGASLEATGLLPAGRPATTRTARWTLADIREAILDPNVEAPASSSHWDGTRCR